MNTRIENTIDPKQHENIFALIESDERFTDCQDIELLIELTAQISLADHRVWKDSVCRYDEAHTDRKLYAKIIEPLHEEKLEAQFQMEKSIYIERGLREFALGNYEGSRAITRRHFERALAESR